MSTITTNKVAVFLDHASAEIIGFENNSSFIIETVDSPYERIKRDEGEGSDKAKFGASPQFASNNENRKNNIAQNELKEYFSILEQKLMKYDNILLFGPTTAKDKLRNVLAENKHFADKNITVETSDKISDNQKLAFVKEYFQ